MVRKNHPSTHKTLGIGAAIVSGVLLVGAGAAASMETIFGGEDRNNPERLSSNTFPGPKLEITLTAPNKVCSMTDVELRGSQIEIGNLACIGIENAEAAK